MRHERIDPAARDGGAGNCAEWHTAENTYTGDPTQHALAALRLGLRYQTDPAAVAPVARLLLTDADIIWIAAVAHHAMPPELADEFHRTALDDVWYRTDWRNVYSEHEFAEAES